MLEIAPVITKEVFRTANVIVSPHLNGYSLVIVVGMIFLLSAFFILIKYKGQIKNRHLLSLTLTFWMPIFFFFAGNNIYDAYKSSANGSSIEEKRQNRICSMDETAYNKVCSVIPFLEYAESKMPRGSKIMIFTIITGAFDYFSYPYFNMVKDIDQADYVILYYPGEAYYMKSDGLYSDEEWLGPFFLISGQKTDKPIFILKRK
ncbi:hypothetical protein GF382_02035 [Candidatus Falkowbacteria bacterium]|nr:hypothetical protein [Candidatus Falkowbacteria bacterium]